MVFCNEDWTFFKLTSKELTKSLLLSITYWATFNVACLEHNPTNGHASWRVEQKITKVYAKVKVFKLDLSSLTYAIILSSKPKESNKDFTRFAIVALAELCISKIPIVTWHGSYEVLMKLTTLTKVSKPAWNIQRSNEHVQIIQDARVGMTHISLALPQYIGAF